MTHVCYAWFNLTCYHALSRHTPSLRSMVVLSGAWLSNARKARTNERWRDLPHPLPPGQYRFKDFRAKR